MHGDDMKRIAIAVILMLVLAACGSSPGNDPHGGSSSGGSSSGTSSSGGSSSGSSSSRGAYSTVSGRVVRLGTGEPYPKAYVRFGWLVDATHEMETHTVTDGNGSYAIQLPAGQYQVTAGDDCDLNAGFAIVGRAPDDVMITVPGISVVNFVEYPITPGADLPGAC